VRPLFVATDQSLARPHQWRALWTPSEPNGAKETQRAASWPSARKVPLVKMVSPRWSRRELRAQPAEESHERQLWATVAKSKPASPKVRYRAKNLPTISHWPHLLLGAVAANSKQGPAGANIRQLSSRSAALSSGQPPPPSWQETRAHSQRHS